MRVDSVEIYSDTTNAAVMRHPGRRFPGVLVQGDTLSNLCRLADRAFEGLDPEAEAFHEGAELREKLRDLLDHYRATLLGHGMDLPFSDPSSP